MKKIAVMFSGGASSVRYLIENDQNYNKNYNFVIGFTDKKDTLGEKYLKENSIPCFHLSLKDFANEHGYIGKTKDMPEVIREKYFEEIINLLKDFDIDIIILSGFMLIISKPLLCYKPIINVHPADLSIKDSFGRPKYIGDDTVTDAIKNGEKYTASTIHVVEDVLDGGRIICISDKLEVLDPNNPKEHQDKMKYLCDGPAYKKALEMICTGEFKF